MYAVVRVRGTVGVSPKIAKTLEIMNLRRANNLCLMPENETSYRMIKTVGDFATFGKIDDKTLEELIAKKAHPTKAGVKIDAKKTAAALKAGKSFKELEIKNCFRMSPPQGGYERGGVKAPYKLGGALGDRKEKINELIISMIHE